MLSSAKEHNSFYLIFFAFIKHDSFLFRCTPTVYHTGYLQEVEYNKEKVSKNANLNDGAGLHAIFFLVKLLYLYMYKYFKRA